MARILVIGRPVWDRVYRMTRWPGPGGTTKASMAGGRPGGSGANLAAGLASAGHDVQLIGWVGQDSIGQQMLRNLDKWGIGTEHLNVVAAPSTECMVFLHESGERTIVRTTDQMPAEPPGVPDGLLQRADWVACWHPRPRAQRPLLEAARTRGTSVLSGVPPEQIAPWPARTIIDSHQTVNGPPEQLFARLRRQTDGDLDELIITEGEHGLRHIRPGSPLRREPAPAVPDEEIVDTTGAGDSFAAGWLHGMAKQEYCRRQARQLGQLWATHSIRRSRSRPVPWDELPDPDEILEA